MAAIQPTQTQETSFGSSRMLWQFLILGIGTLIAMGGGALIGLTQQGTWVVLGIIAVFTGIVMVIRPAFGVFVLVAFVYLNASDIIEVQFGIPSLNKILVALIFIGVLGTRLVIRRKPLTFRSTEALLILYGLVILISGMSGSDPSAAFTNIIDYAKDIAIVLILVQVCDTESVWKNVQWIVMFCAAFLALLTTYQMVTGDTSNTFYGLANAPVHQITENFDNTRPTGPLDDPNFYSQILMMVLPLCIYRALDDAKPRNRIIGTVFSGLIALAVIFTYSRSAFVMMAGLVFLIILERRMNVFKLVIIGTIILVAAFPLLPKGFLDRIATLGGTDELSAAGSQEASFQGRSSEMIVAVEMFLDHPIIGIGYAAYDTNYIQYSSRLGLDGRLENREAHSLYLEAAAETGILGFASLGLVIVFIFLNMARDRERVRLLERPDLVSWINGLQFGLLSYLLTSIFLHDGYVRYLRLSIALAVSASAFVDALARQNEEKRKKGLKV